GEAQTACGVFPYCSEFIFGTNKLLFSLFTFGNVAGYIYKFCYVSIFVSYRSAFYFNIELRSIAANTPVFVWSGMQSKLHFCKVGFCQMEIVRVNKIENCF